jgi:IS30 family transposase
MQVQRHLGSEEQIEVIQLHQTGKRINAVARKFKRHRTTVTAILDHHNVLVQSHYMTENYLDQAQRLFESGYSLAAVGRRLGFDAQTIRTHLIRAGIPIQAAHERRSASPE